MEKRGLEEREGRGGLEWNAGGGGRVVGAGGELAGKVG